MTAFLWIGGISFACLAAIMVLGWLAPDMTHPGVFVRRPDRTWGALFFWLAILLVLLLVAAMCYYLVAFVVAAYISP